MLPVLYEPFYPSVEVLHMAVVMQPNQLLVDRSGGYRNTVIVV